MAYEGEGRELNNIDFTPDFFRDEVREGFYVSTMMKRYWASQLKVLSIIARICDKYGLKWFADYGTLLGTVRHGGYVPWDDDLDICMLREDYEKLFGVLEKELPKDFKVLSLEKEPEYVEMIGRVVNSSVIDYGKEHLNEFYGCPYTVGIDIFPLDGVYNDPQKEEERSKRANAVTDEVKKFESSAEGSNSIKKNRLLRKLEKIYKECPVEGAEKVALMNFYLSRGDHLYPKELFDQVVKLPFEETFMNVPARYEEVLSIEYGDYMRVFKGGGMHDYPVYHDQEEILRQNLGGNPFRYTFDMNQLLVSVSRYAKRMLEKAGNAAGGNVAGDLSGTGNRKVAVFLPCRAVWWGTMEPLWQKFCADPSMEVHVLPIFYYDCDHNGNIGEKHDERALFPEYLKVEACEKFDFEGIHPDVIVIQQPYDGHDMAFTVHEFFYSGNLLNFTDELIYVPCVDMDPPIDENDKAATAISVFIEQEGVVNADRVVLPNERLRRLYIDTLVALSSEDTRQYWEQKIVASEGEKTEEKSGDSKDRKTIVYHIGISSLLKYGREAINKIRENLEIFEAASDRLDVIILPQKQLMDNLPQMEPQVFGEFEKAMAEIPAGGNITYDPEQAALLRQDEWDAYYGDPSPLVRKCVERKIPVMIQNYEIRN